MAVQPMMARMNQTDRVPENMRLDVLAGELVTGRRLTVLPVLDGDYSSVLGAEGDITIVLPLKDAKVAARRREFFSQLEPWRCFLAVQVDQDIIEAGPIVSHEYDDTNGHLTVKAQGLRAIFSRREAVNNNSSNPQASSLYYDQMSLGTIGKRLVQQTMNNPGGYLPIVLPADEPGTSERTYRGFDRSKIGEMLDNLSGVEDGPEFAFTPRLTADGNGVEWVMRSGTEGDRLLHQTGDDWIFDTTTRGAVGRVGAFSDASNRINSASVTGSGMDQATMISRKFDSGEWDRGYPLIEDTFSHYTVTRQRTLDSKPAAYLQQGSAPWSTWSLVVRRDEFPILGSYQAGDWCQVLIRDDHPYLPGGWHRVRIASITGSIKGRTVELGMMPTLDGR